MSPRRAQGSQRAGVRVLFVSPGGAGGAERALRWLIERLGGDWVAGAAVLHDGALADWLRAEGHAVEVLPERTADAVRAVRRVICASGPDLIHANGFKAAATVAPAALGTNAPVLWTKVDLARDGAPALAIGLLCQQIVAVSEAAAATFGSLLRGRISVVPNGIPDRAVDRHAGRGALARLLGCPEEAPLVVLSGRLFPGKGQHELLEAAPALLERHPDLRVGLLGGPDPFYPHYERYLRSRAAELGIDGAVTFAGHREDAVELVSGADVLVAPSVHQREGGWREGFGLMVAEAFLVGTPVVAYRSGSLPEVVGPCGRLVEEGDRKGLAGAVLELLQDPDERRRMADCGRSRARDQYMLSTYVERMRDRYAAALAGSRWRPRGVHRVQAAGDGGR